MTRQNTWGRKTIQAIRRLLGDACSRCGATADLELHCIQPQGHRHHAQSAISRACFYRRQLAQGNLAVLCRSCHVAVTAAEGTTEVPTSTGSRRSFQPYSSIIHGEQVSNSHNTL